MNIRNMSAQRRDTSPQMSLHFNVHGERDDSKSRNVVAVFQRAEVCVRYRLHCSPFHHVNETCALRILIRQC